MNRLGDKFRPKDPLECLILICATCAAIAFGWLYVMVRS